MAREDFLESFLNRDWEGQNPMAASLLEDILVNVFMKSVFVLKSIAQLAV